MEYFITDLVILLFLTVEHNLCVISFPTRDRTWDSLNESTEFQPVDGQGSLSTNCS